VSLTAKREKFAQAIASGMSQAAAYREAFSTAKMSAPAIYVEAGRLVDDPKVSLRIAELRAPAVAAVGITLESHLRDLLALRNMAAKEKQISAAISAEIARGKAAGVVVDRAALELTGKNGGPLQSVNMTQSEFAAIAAKVAAGI
jgi:phage terminase small subunit